ncbi:HupE/UreJ family protein [Flagellimonas beolgyonensis]|uniref:HupE/UreJ family protein n=1 Tax=Flagellimonas beolgyonensis TaxID=864064 RepID=UPI003D64BCD4
MEEFMFYVKMGLDHVLDFSAYDHILFLSALAVPFTFKNWKHVLILATIFTVAHCTSLALSVYEVVTADVGLIEFLIPVTIFITALFNFTYVFKEGVNFGELLHYIATGFFGLIHGFGFSNYFKMLMAEEEDKITPLLGFATGIELSQVTIILMVLALAFLSVDLLKLKRTLFIAIASILIIAITIPLLIATFPQ